MNRTIQSTVSISRTWSLELSSIITWPITTHIYAHGEPRVDVIIIIAWRLRGRNRKKKVSVVRQKQ